MHVRCADRCLTASSSLSPPPSQHHHSNTPSLRRTCVEVEEEALNPNCFHRLVRVRFPGQFLLPYYLFQALLQELGTALELNAIHLHLICICMRGKGGTMSRANEMFRADSRMMVVFGAFTSKSEPLTFEESLRFVKKVKARNYMLYLSLFNVLGRMELSQLEAYRELQLLFQNHPDLCEELENFRPPMPTKQAVNNIWPWVFVCAVPLVAVSLIPALGNPVMWFVQQTLGEKMAA